jgi:hypothetical protein
MDEATELFVVLRLDSFPVDDPTENISATKWFADQQSADREAARLNDLNGGKGAKYFVRLVRAAIAARDIRTSSETVG